MRAELHGALVAEGIEATCSTVTSSHCRSAGRRGGAGGAGHVERSADDGWVLCSSGSTTELDRPAQAEQHVAVRSAGRRRSRTAPRPGIHGRNAAGNARPASGATARRVVRSDAVNRIAVIFSCATSARILPAPLDEFSSFGRNSSSPRAAATGPDSRRQASPRMGRPEGVPGSGRPTRIRFGPHRS